MSVLVACDCRGEELSLILRRHGSRVISAGLNRAVCDNAALASLVIVCLSPCGKASPYGGLNLCTELATRYGVALIAISDSDNAADCIRALNAGCDDYFVMPMHSIELMARVDAVLRRVNKSFGSCPLDRGPLCIDTRAREVRMYDEKVGLTRKEFDLLWFLAARAESAVSREEIASQIWGGDIVASSRTIDTHVNSLRRKLGRSTVVTVRGYGFRFGGPAAQAEAADPV